MSTDETKQSPGPSFGGQNASSVNEEFRLDAVSSPRLNPPSMTDSNIESYFMSLEFWFAATGIGHDTKKYHIVMAQVPPEKLNELRSIIDGTPATDKYLYIKTRLIAHFADSQQKRLQKVLSDMPLGDMKPSHLFNEMRRVAGAALCEAILLDLWAARLPPYAQAAVIASQGNAIEKNRIADAIVESMNLRNITSIEIPNTSYTPSATSEPSATSIEALQMEIAQLTRRFDRAFSGRNRSRSRGRYESSSRETQLVDGPCWYHRTFGRDARTCRKPCNFNHPTSSNTSRQ
ncbi:uncharacterized protein LOC129758222 [Uranotaenia lowii]|uniref:uncharacterized protein LOC129758222 n=1 Tax=Uranotaenia lowii TaxID=190385 RepID=UPI002479D848|nr:uncharacterized protein LOC129758222 [Uranotaenia lowii]